MALIVLDDCAVAIAESPTNNGFVMRFSEGALPDNLAVIVPFEGVNAEEVLKGILEAMGRTSKIVTASPPDMQREVRRHGVDIAE
jgi:hypothetical protein